MERAWLGVWAAMTVLAFGCSPASATSTSVLPTAGVEPGVTIDEGSPAAKEYALALTQARHTGSSSSGTHASSSEAPFGTGITPPSSGGTGGSPGSGAGSAHARTHGTRATAKAKTGGESTRPSAPLPAAVLQADRAASSGGDGSLLALLGGGVAILVLGGLGGVVLRHNRRPPSHA